MKNKMMIFTMLVLLLGSVPSAYSADVAKIGVVFMQKILVESSAGKIIKNKLQAHNNKLLNALNDEKKRLDLLADEIKKLKLLPDSLDKNKMAAKKEELEAGVKAFYNLEQKSRSEMKKMESDLMKSFSADVNKIVRDIGKKEGYLLILEKREAGIFYAPEQIDITDQITSLLNQQTAKIK
jgi:outer membrane protein